MQHEPLEERRLLAVDLSLGGSPLAEDGGVATFTATTDLLASHGGIHVDLDFSGSAELGVDYLLKAQQLGTDIDGLAAGDEAGVSVDVNSDGTIIAVGAHRSVDRHLRRPELSFPDVARLLACCL